MNPSSQSQTQPFPLSSTFDDFNLKPELLRGIYSIGYEKPSLIQQHLLHIFPKNNDIITQYLPSTGKTSSYIIYSLQCIEYSKLQDVQCLVLTSTRDQALAVGNLYKELSRYTKARIHAFVGGTSHIDDIKKFSDGCHIVVGTPGRVIYMLNKKILSLSELKLFIIDKVDEVFERGFSESIKSITGMISDNCKKAIFCSRKDYTDISTIEQVLQMKNVINININTEQPENLLSNLRQYKIKCDDDDKKFETLLTLYQHMEISQVILFCNTKSKCESINEQLNKEGFISSYICDDKDEVIAAFKSGYIRVIITTGDTSSKEIDIYQTSIVINYEMPTSKDEYVKRIGRSESFGKRGIVINFITNKDISLLTEIEQVSPGKVINELPFELSL